MSSPPQDQRILGALTQRMSEEEQLASLRKKEAWQWEQERREEERDRREWEKRHQQKVAQSQKVFQRQVSRDPFVTQELAFSPAPPKKNPI